MKKTLFQITVLYFTMLISSCGASGDATKSNNVDTAKDSNPNTSKFIGDTTIFTTGPRLKNTEVKKSLGTSSIINVNYFFVDSLDHLTAINYITNFNIKNLTDKNNYFTIDISEFQNFIAATTNGTPSTYIQFLPAYNDPSKLTLVITGINLTGDNVYVKKGTGKANVLSLSSNLSGNTPFTTPTAPPPSDRIILRLINNLIYTNANTIVSNYLGDQSKSDNTKSFAVDADLLIDYVNKAISANAVKCNFFLGEDGGKLVLILSSIDNSGNYIYFNDHQDNSCLYEHCYPCPPCSNFNASGSQIEN